MKNLWHLLLSVNTLVTGKADVQLAAELLGDFLFIVMRTFQRLPANLAVCGEIGHLEFRQT